MNDILIGISIIAAYFLRKNFQGFMGLLSFKIFSNTGQKTEIKERGFDIDNSSVISDCRNFYNWTNGDGGHGWSVLADDSFFSKLAAGAGLTLIIWVFLIMIFS